MQMARGGLVIPDIPGDTVAHTECSELPGSLMTQMRI